MSFLNPPSYDDVINDTFVYGKPDDLARATSVVTNSKIFAALRPSEDAVNNTQVRWLKTLKSLLMQFLFTL